MKIQQVPHYADRMERLVKRCGPGLFQAIVAHDKWCPQERRPPGAFCICNPILVVLDHEGREIDRDEGAAR